MANAPVGINDHRHDRVGIQGPDDGNRRSQGAVAILRRLVVVATVLLVGGCASMLGVDALNKTLANSTEAAIAAIDRAVAALSNQSTQWQVVVQNLEANLAADVQSTVRNEVTTLTRNGVQTVGVEVRCNAEYMRIGLTRELIRLRNRLAADVNRIAPGAVKIVDEIPTRPFICTAAPSSVDLRLEPERRSHVDIYGFDLRSAPITVTLITGGSYRPRVRDLPFRTFRDQLRSAQIRPGEETIVASSYDIVSPALRFDRVVSNALSVISDFHAVLDLTASGFEVLPNSLSIGLSWDAALQSEIAVLTDLQLATCTNMAVQWNASGTESQTFVPPAVTTAQYGSTPDRDFDGNGPCVTFDLTLRVDATRKKLFAVYNMDAWECKGDFGTIHSDYTEATGGSSTVLYTAADNEKILGFDVDQNFSHRYYDTTTDRDDTFTFAGLTPVSSLIYVGDTGGQEAGSRTKVTMHFRPINIRVERCEGGSTGSTGTPSGSAGSCVNRQCGSDGAGGSCGTCTAPAVCQSGRCTLPANCTPDCRGRRCGSDGCGGSCGTCPAGQFCSQGDGYCLKPGQHPR